MRQQLARRGLPTSIAAVTAVLVVGALGTAGMVGAAGYLLGYSPGYYFGYGTADCPTSATCSDPNPVSRTAPTSRGVALNGEPIGGRVSVSPNSFGPGAFTTLSIDVAPATSSPVPAAVPGVTETALSNLVSFGVSTRSGSSNGPASPAVNTGRPLTHRRLSQGRADPVDTVSQTRDPSRNQPGIPADQIVAYVRDAPGAGWRELPRLTGRPPSGGRAQALPAGQTEGFRVDEYAYTWTFAGNTYSSVYREVLAFTRRASGTFYFARRTGTPTPATPQPVVVPPAGQVVNGLPPRPSFTGRLPSRVTADRRGRFTVRCSTTSVTTRARCRGTATTTTSLRARKKKLTVATGSAPLVNGQATVRFQLNRAALRKLRRARRLPVQVTLTVSGAPVALTRTSEINLVAAKKGKP